jgi:FkbM family methyltransferase
MNVAHPLGKAIRAALAAVVLLVVLVAVWPKARLFAVWSLGRANGCSCGDSTRGHDFLVHFNETAQRIGGASRVIERDPQGLDLVETPLGQYWTVKNDRFLNFSLAEEAVDIYGQRDEGPRRGDVVLDCGANIGVFTHKALSAGARLVVAIEPTPISVECLRRNFAREIAEGRVIVYPKGVWNRVDTLELATEGEGNSVGNSVVFGRDLKNKIQVPLTTIDLLTAELHLDRVDFIKMDIEGAEKQALTGAAETIRKYRPRMAIASEHLPDDFTAIPQTVKAIWPGYRVTPSSCKDHFSTVEPEVLLFERP